MKLQEQKEKEKESKDDALINIVQQTTSPEQNFRVTGIYGDINEERSLEAVLSLLYLKETSKTMELEDPEDLDSPVIETIAPIDFYVSTFGGSAPEMFCVFDTIRMVREDCPVHTIGLGKVMSAGVLLLASGTKGERRIGANCRIMIHGVISGQQGHILDMENEMQETKFTQKQYIKALSSETNMSETYIRKLIRKKTNIYFDAEKAVELGIADKII